jgi:hypothetical protein
VPLVGEVARHPADGLRRDKALFAELGGGAERVARENAGPVEFQRSGPGLPGASARVARPGSPSGRPGPTPIRSAHPPGQRHDRGPTKRAATRHESVRPKWGRVRDQRT